LKKTLIEEPTIELLELFDKVSEEAVKEKHAIPPINKILYWWTRKPLIVGRAVALSSTLNDISTVKELLGFNKQKRAYEYAPNKGIYQKKLGKDPSKIKLLDPFGGAGNLVFESKRLGLDCSISDYNPVAYLVEKSVLEYPVKYGINLAKDFEQLATSIIQKIEKEIGKFYEKNDLVYFWVWCIICPHCGQRFPLSNNMWIVNTKKDKIGVRFNITPDKNFTSELIYKIKSTEGNKYTQKGGKAICISCKNTINYEAITSDIAKRKDRELIVKQIQGRNRREYLLASKQDKKRFEDAKKNMKLKLSKYINQNLIPDEDIKPSHRREEPLWHYGIRHWKDFVSARQLLLFTTLMKIIKQECSKLDTEHGKIMATYLSFMLCRHLDHNSLGAQWSASKETIGHVLAMKQPRIVFNHVELNPFGIRGGALKNMMINIINAISFATKNQSIPNISMDSVLSNHQKKYDLIITDPPYLDDVHYGESSEFFYVWLSRILRDYYPELPIRAPLDEDICETQGRFGNQKLAHAFFEKGFKKSFLSLDKKLNGDGLLVVFFAHSSPDAWNILLEAIREAKFHVVSSYALHTEKINVLTKGKTAFLSSIVIACRKLTTEKTAYFEEIVPETEDNIKQMMKKIPLEKLLVLPITDLLIMMYGQVLETCTQFTELKSYEKDSEPKLKKLISQSQDFIMKEIVSKLTGRNMNLIGPQMAFYLLTKIFFRGKINADDAIKISKAVTIDIDKLIQGGIVTREGGIITLNLLHQNDLELKPEELDQANLYQQLCYLAKICHTKGASKVSSILSQSSGKLKVDDLKKIVPLFVKSYRLRINKNQKLDDSEREELKILETISDIWGGTVIEGTLDKFVEKK